MTKNLLYALGAFALLGCLASPGQSAPAKSGEKYPVHKTEAEWKKQLGSQAYYVFRKAGTERAFTGKYWDNKKKGVYRCAGCNAPLFASDTKFKSGTGWPSFWRPLNDKAVEEHADYAFGMVRTEVRCATCGGHLGHVFDDGPRPTGLRYCINSVSLDFEEKAAAKAGAASKEKPAAAKR